MWLPRLGVWALSRCDRCSGWSVGGRSVFPAVLSACLEEEVLDWSIAGVVSQLPVNASISFLKRTPSHSNPHRDHILLA